MQTSLRMTNQERGQLFLKMQFFNDINNPNALVSDLNIGENILQWNI